MLVSIGPVTSTNDPTQPDDTSPGFQGYRQDDPPMRESVGENDGATGVPETQVVTQQVEEEAEERAKEEVIALTQALLPATQTTDKAPPDVNTNPAWRNASSSSSTEGVHSDKNKGGVNISQVELSMEKIKSALEKLEGDIERSKQEKEMSEANTETREFPPPGLPIKASANPQDQEKASSEVWRVEGDGVSSNDSHQMLLPLQQSQTADYLPDIRDKQINLTRTDGLEEKEGVDDKEDGETDYSQDVADVKLGGVNGSSEASTQTAWRWNIQNGTNYSQPPMGSDLELGLSIPLGKVCILLNGTVVKDMEEAECKSQAGLHYKYVPSRLRKNGTARMNSTTGPFTYTEAPGSEEAEEDAGADTDPETGQATWEDAQWDLYNRNLEENDTYQESTWRENNTEQLFAGNPLSGRLLNISQTVPDPFESVLNGSGPLETSPAIWHAGKGDTPSGSQGPPLRDSPMDLLLPGNHGNRDNMKENQHEEVSSQVFKEHKGSSGTVKAGELLANRSSVSNTSSSPPLPQGRQPDVGSNDSQLLHKGPQAMPTRVQANVSALEKAEKPQTSHPGVTLEEGVDALGINSSHSPGGQQRTENSTAIKVTENKTVDNQSSLYQPNPKFRHHTTSTTHKPHPDHVHRSRKYFAFILQSYHTCLNKLSDFVLQENSDSLLYLFQFQTPMKMIYHSNWQHSTFDHCIDTDVSLTSKYSEHILTDLSTHRDHIHSCYKH